MTSSYGTHVYAAVEASLLARRRTVDTMLLIACDTRLRALLMYCW